MDNKQPDATEQQVKKLAEQWAAAELHNDTSFLERILADNFVSVGPLGFLLTKEEWLARHRSGDLKYESFGREDVTVRLYGDAAVLIGRETQHGSYQQFDISGQLRATLVMV